MVKEKNTEDKVAKSAKKKAEDSKAKTANILDLRKEEKTPEKSPTKKTKKFSLKTIIGILVAIIIVVNLGFAYGIYVLGWTNSSTKTFVKIFPYPSARAGMHFVGMNEYYKDIDSFITYYKTVQKVDFSTADGKKVLSDLKKDILDRLLDQKVIASEAKKLNISISNSDVDSEYNKLAKDSGEETLKKQIKDYYNWDVSTFKNEIKKALLQTKLQESVKNNDTLNKDQKKEIDALLKRVSDGEDFATLAKETSESTDATDGGGMGWFAKGTYDSSYEDKVFGLEKGRVSDVIKTSEGYEIVKVEDKKDDQVSARHILIKYADFKKWLDNKKKEYGIQKFIDSEKIKL